MQTLLLELALDLTANLTAADRYERLLGALVRVVPCDAATLLRMEGGALRPLAARGLLPEVEGRTFLPAEHPRLARILASEGPVRVDDHDLPDPFDGLMAGGHELARVHACMGCALRVEGEVVGALTVDALDPAAFDAVDTDTFATFAALAGAAMRTAGLIEALERASRRQGLIARQLLREAQQREGGAILGVSAATRRLRDEVEMLAASDLTVLVTGETGVGKEVVARALHARSRRAAEPLMYVNCAALPDTIAESELFGHLKGAFTGASEARAGKFEAADGGTLFLDEVGELPLSTQPKLLRALQFGEVQRVGADRPLSVDVRVVAATNRDLEAEVEAGRFRADLFHRLNVYPLPVAPLRARREDIPIFAGFFLDQARSRLGVGALRLTPAALTALRAADWPGNVRELEHVVMRAALRAAQGVGRGTVVVDAHHLGELGSVAPAPPAASVAAVAVDRSLADATEAFRRDYVERALAANDGNLSAAARDLGVDRGNLHRLARRLGIIE